MSTPDRHIDYGSAVSVTEAIETRRSLRAFLPKPVSDDTIRHLLTTAARAPSGTNMQPWNTYVLTGDSRNRLCEHVCRAFDDPDAPRQAQVNYYPDTWFEPFLSRRRKVGWDLYSLLDIKKGEREKTQQQHRRNFQFFDAPVGLIFTIHTDLATGSWLDYGMYLQNLMLLAREAGLHSCPQAAWADYHVAVREVLTLEESEVVVCGLALGYADAAMPENRLVTERASLEDNVQFLS